MTDHALASTLAWLQTEAGDALLAEAEALPTDRLTRLTRLRRRYPADIVTAAVELLELRRRARSKFPQADAMLFTAEGLEQATGDPIARYRASRFPSGSPVLDACCGIGGDACLLAERGPVLAVDRNPAAAACARANADLMDPSPHAPVAVLCADVTALPWTRLRAHGFRAAFFDPSRRLSDREGQRRRARRSEDYSPPLDFLTTLRESFPALAVKVSPAIDDDTLQRYPAQVEFLSERGECKEAVLWFGPLLRPDVPFCADPTSCYLATVLRPGREPATLLPFPCDLPPLALPRAWLYEPDPAVIRAHLVPQVASLLGGALLDPQIAYLTADAPVVTPFATAYRVLDWLPYHVKQIQARLLALGRHTVAIKKRGVPMEPEALHKLLPGAPAGEPPAVVVLTRRADKIIALLCAPSEEASSSE